MSKIKKRILWKSFLAFLENESACSNGIDWLYETKGSLSVMKWIDKQLTDLSNSTEIQDNRQIEVESDYTPRGYMNWLTDQVRFKLEIDPESDPNYGASIRHMRRVLTPTRLAKAIAISKKEKDEYDREQEENRCQCDICIRAA